MEEKCLLIIEIKTIKKTKSFAKNNAAAFFKNILSFFR